MTNQDQISIAAQRVAAIELSVQAAEAEAKTAGERLSALFARRDAIAREISDIRGSRLAGEVPDSEAARVHLLSLDQLDIQPLIESATNMANKSAAKVQAESMALTVARRDLQMATKRAEIEAVEQQARAAEKKLMQAIAELGELKREAGFNWRVASDVYRPGYDLDRLTRLGVVPPVEGA